MIYCMGKECKISSSCIYNKINDENVREVLDYSIMGSGRLTQEMNEIEYYCGDLGHYARFESIRNKKVGFTKNLKNFDIEKRSKNNILPNDLPESIKYCTKCEKYFDINSKKCPFCLSSEVIIINFGESKAVKYDSNKDTDNKKTEVNKVGYWEKDPTKVREDGNIYDYRCSVCKGEAIKDDLGLNTICTDFCHHCNSKLHVPTIMKNNMIKPVKYCLKCGIGLYEDLDECPNCHNREP